MPEISYVPDPRAGYTPASREYDCDCATSGSSSGGSGGLVGTGSPEGVVTSDPGGFYADISTNAIWVKETGTGTNTGWVLYLS
jgi:hypothetical protein